MAWHRCALSFSPPPLLSGLNPAARVPRAALLTPRPRQPSILIPHTRPPFRPLTRILPLLPLSPPLPKRYKDVPLPAIPGYNQDDYYLTVFSVVKKGCGTSAVTGSFTITIDGTKTLIKKAMFMAMSNTVNNPPPKNQAGEFTGLKAGQWVYLHETIHGFGAGYHSNLFK